jgi:hypothetical protein
MSQRDVGITISRLLTDEEFRDRFVLYPLDTLAGLALEGVELQRQTRRRRLQRMRRSVAASCGVCENRSSGAKTGLHRGGNCVVSRATRMCILTHGVVEIDAPGSDFPGIGFAHTFTSSGRDRADTGRKEFAAIAASDYVRKKRTL